jgi:hypothetical protein
MREERTVLPSHFLALLNHYVWQATKYYNSDHLKQVVIPRVSGIQFRVARITTFCYGLISRGDYERAYLSELNNLINEFVRECEEILDSSLSDEEKFSKLDGHVYAFDLRLAVLEDEVKREYVKKTLEEYLENNREVFGKDFTLIDLYYLLKRILSDKLDEEEGPLGSDDVLL